MPLLYSYSCHVTCVTHIRPSCLMMNHIPNMLQQHLSLSIPNLPFNESIQYFVTDSYISSNTLIQLGFPSYDYLGDLPIFLKTFATSDMDDRKDISSKNSIHFDESNKRYAHSTGGRKIQTIPTNISPLRPFPEYSKHISYIFGNFDIDEGNPLHLS